MIKKLVQIYMELPIANVNNNNNNILYWIDM